MRNEDFRLIVDLFKYNIIQITGDKSYKFVMSENRSISINKFISRFKEMTDANFLSKDLVREFIEFQFNHWYNLNYKTKGGSRGIYIQIDWIVGNKAFERWNSRTVKQKKKTQFIINKNLKTDIKYKELGENKKQSSDEYKRILKLTHDYEEEAKERFMGTSKGFLYCQVSTTLYNHKSVNCGVCKYSQDCKELLKDNFPKIFKLRGYETI